MCGSSTRRDVGVVLEQIALGEPELRPEDLAEVGEPDFLAVDGEDDVVLIAGNRSATLGSLRTSGAAMRCGLAATSPSASASVAPAAAASAAARREATAPSDRHVLQLDAVAARGAAAGRRGSCRRGRRSRSGTAAARRRSPASTSTYFGDAMLPSSTTSQSGPISAQQRPRARLERTAVRRRCRRRCRRCANARTAARVTQRVRDCAARRSA